MTLSKRPATISPSLVESVRRKVSIGRSKSQKRRVVSSKLPRRSILSTGNIFLGQIEPLLSRPFIEFVGEIGEQDKGEFLGNAAALLFPIDWPEPFGLVMIEALACGTPVIAFDSRFVPDRIENGATGFVVSNLDEAASAVERTSTLNRWKCREAFEQRFSASRMASDYLDIYRWLVLRREGDGAGMTVFRPAA